MTSYRFRKYVIPMAKRLAAAILEMDWSARLNPMNHCELFPTVVTAMVDTFPIQV